MKDYAEMTYDELLKEYERIHNKEFMLQMKDRWSGDDCRQSRENTAKMNRIKQLMQEKAGKDADNGTESK